MTVSKECKTHGGVDARFTCSACGEAFCKDCLGRADEGQSICIGCSIKQSTKKATNGSRENVGQRRERVAGVDAQREMEMDNKKWLVVLLMIALPVVGFELFLLNTTAPAEVVAEDAALVDVGSSLVMITALNHYRDVEGEYPLSLDRLVPEFWDSDRVALLDRFKYRRVSAERFDLRNLHNTKPEGAAGIRNLVPETLEAGDSIGDILQQI